LAEHIPILKWVKSGMYAAAIPLSGAVAGSQPQRALLLLSEAEKPKSPVIYWLR